jgi:hypothetical protein
MEGSYSTVLVPLFYASYYGMVNTFFQHSALLMLHYPPAVVLHTTEYMWLTGLVQFLCYVASFPAFAQWIIQDEFRNTQFVVKLNPVKLLFFSFVISPGSILLANGLLRAANPQLVDPYFGYRLAYAPASTMILYFTAECLETHTKIRRHLMR